jgi:hypothetical protein
MDAATLCFAMLVELGQGLRMTLGIALFIVIAGMVGWAIWDVFEHTDYGIVWLVSFLVFPPLIPVYVFMSLYSRRATQRSPVDGGREFSMGSELDRARFIEAAQDGRGTLYEPSAMLGGGGLPRKAFTDHKADEMLAARHYDAAATYLTEMLELAQSDGDPDRLSTYRWYLSQLPDGRGLAAQKAVEGDHGTSQSAERRTLPF